jgi:hypothetical protein
MTYFKFIAFLSIIAICAFPFFVFAQSKKTTPISQPLVSHINTADPSAHVFNGKIYIYPSHDIEAGIKENDLGDHFDMRDYHNMSFKFNTTAVITKHSIKIDNYKIAI